MKLVILAAGVGSRLMPLTRNTPKSLLDIGNGYTLLETQLQAASEAGIKNIKILTGYRSEQIEAKIIEYHGKLNIECTYNPFFALANNIVSAWFGLMNEKEPLVLMNGDDCFKPSVLEGLLARHGDITLVVSRKDSYDADDMKVVTKGENILDIGKTLPAETATGESIGMMHFSERGIASVRGMIEKMIRDDAQAIQLFYLEAIRRLIKQGTPVTLSECGPDDWREVDFHPDLTEMRDYLTRHIKF